MRYERFFFPPKLYFLEYTREMQCNDYLFLKRDEIVEVTSYIKVIKYFRLVKDINHIIDIKLY